ncbi:MAG TPA: hypothetical protein PKW21_02270 [Rhabdaerophilum sp.]|nr:hypothetical protein [Rhabdaerophilum sp.]
MNPASVLAEAIRNSETVAHARERLAAAEHVANHYRAIALPALAAATLRIANVRKARRTRQPASLFAG